MIWVGRVWSTYRCRKSLVVRAVVALASDPEPMKRTGQAFWVADLAREYGFTDIDGSIPDAEKLHEQLKQGAPAFWREVLGG